MRRGRGWGWLNRGVDWEVGPRAHGRASGLGSNSSEKVRVRGVGLRADGRGSGWSTGVR